MTVNDQLTYLRWIVNETDTTNPSDATLTVLLQDGAERLNDICNYHNSDASGSLSAGTAEISLPSDCVRPLRVRVGTQIIEKTSEDREEGRGRNIAGLQANVPMSYYLVGTTIGFTPTPVGTPAYVIRYISTPATSIAQLPSQLHKIPCYWAAATWFASENGGFQQGASKSWMDLFTAAATAAKDLFASYDVRP